MTELCIYQITNTVLKNDLIILVFYGIFTDMKKGDYMKYIYKITGKEV